MKYMSFEKNKMEVSDDKADGYSYSCWFCKTQQEFKVNDLDPSEIVMINCKSCGVTNKLKITIPQSEESKGSS